MRSNGDKLITSLQQTMTVAAMLRVGLQQDLKVKFMEFRLETGVTVLSNESTRRSSSAFGTS